jgi:hypothetical protein
MPKRGKVEDVLGKAAGLEKKYDWIKAADLYKQALGLVGKRDFSRAGEIQERVGFCLHRGAFQAESQEEFKSRMLEAVEAYEKAAELYQKVEHPKSLYCEALALYVNSWTLIDASRKKEVLGGCGKLLKEAMKAFEEAGDRLDYGKACNDLLSCLYDGSFLEWDWTENRRRLEEAIRHGQDAINTLSKVADERELARAYILAGLNYLASRPLAEEHMKERGQTALSYAEKALKISKEIGEGYLIACSSWLAAGTQYVVTGNLELSLKYCEEALQQAKEMKDSFLIGWTYWGLALVTSWKMNMEEDPDKTREGYEKVIRYAEDGLHHLLLVIRHDWLASLYSWYIESYYFLALNVETDPEAKRRLLERGIEIGRKGLEYAQQSGVPQISSVHHSLSKALYSLSKMETQATEKKRLLEQAAVNREKAININEQAGFPFDYWNRGVYQNYAALIKAELATIEADKEKKKSLLEEAVSHMERCVELCTKNVAINPQAHLFVALGWYSDWFGGILNQLYALTGEEETLRKAVEIYEDTSETYRKAELPSRVAEAQWQVARLSDRLGEHTRSEWNFQSAAENYKLTAEKIPQLKEFYMDHALYMQAWSEIQKAKRHHAKRQYGQSKEHYEKAADLHQSTEHWNYLSSNYLAWAKLEEAEDLSRREQGEEATETFKEAADIFCNAKNAIKTKLKDIQDRDEREMASALIKASDLRHGYCQGRIALEEAKILDRRGNHMESSKKYEAAAKTLQDIGKAESEQTRRELQPIVLLCQAWQKMMMAEAKASPTMYGEAAELFERAKEHTLDQPTSLLALANSSFCKALEAGTEFETTGDMTTYSTAKKHMEAAEKRYLKAGFKNASEYARATHMLFDAYMYLNKAETETEPRRKAQYYQMAEKVLQASAGSYMKAKHPEKSEEVQRLLESVKEKRELAMSLTEVLHAPTITSTTTSFSTPTPTHEQAVGLERFEHADIQASLILRVKEVKVGQDVDLEIELVNAGKAPALLIKVQELIPVGFEIKRAPETYRVEDRYLNMKGKKLVPLKTEEIRLVLRPAAKGTFILKPRIMYLDETGKYKSHEPEPVTITVKELGIKGWIKGER